MLRIFAAVTALALMAGMTPMALSGEAVKPACVQTLAQFGDIVVTMGSVPNISNNPTTVADGIALVKMEYPTRGELTSLIDGADTVLGFTYGGHMLLSFAKAGCMIAGPTGKPLAFGVTAPPAQKSSVGA